MENGLGFGPASAILKQGLRRSVCDALWDPDRGDGIDRSVLDSGLSDPGIERDRSLFSECQTGEKCQWAQVGHAGLPVVTNPTQLWIVTGIVSAGERHWGVARLYAAPSDADRICRGSCATHAESPDADEPAASARHFRYHGLDRHEDPSSDCGR